MYAIHFIDCIYTLKGNLAYFLHKSERKFSKELNMKNLKSGFTLIELIMVTIILGILAAVAIPRYMSTVTKSEEAAEDAVIASIKAGLENVALNSMMENGRRVWSRNPFDNVKIDGYVGEQRSPWQINDHEWSYFVPYLVGFKH